MRGNIQESFHLRGLLLVVNMLLGSFTPEGESERVDAAVFRSLEDKKPESSYLIFDKFRVTTGSTARADGWGTGSIQLRAPGVSSRR